VDGGILKLARNLIVKSERLFRLTLSPSFILNPAFGVGRGLIFAFPQSKVVASTGREAQRRAQVSALNEDLEGSSRGFAASVAAL
jgi:hypothetical protein